MATREVWVASTSGKPFEQSISVGSHEITADEPTPDGGGDVGPTPYDLVLAGLGACTSMTLMLYARRKKWPLERALIRLTHERVHASDCAHPGDPACRMERIAVAITLVGAELTAEQRARLKEIADHCPVHKTLTGKLEIETNLVD